MVFLAGYLEVLLKALTLVGLSAAIGGVVFVAAVLRPFGAVATLARRARHRSLALITAGAGLLVVSQCLALLLSPWALANESGQWPIARFLATGFARAGLLHVALALTLCGAGLWLLARPASRTGRIALLLAAAMVLVSGAWLTHAVSRLQGAEGLMAVTVIHQFGAAAWAGGLMHLALLWRLVKDAPGGRAAWPDFLRRFSTLAMLAVLTLVAAGVFLAWRYIGDLEGLAGTAYGTLTAIKAALLAGALGLGAGNFALVRRWRRSRERSGLFAKVPAFAEAELGLGLVLLLAAASLISQPPARDVVAERATPAEVLEVFIPKQPQLVPPPFPEMIAEARSVLDAFSVPSRLDRIQSNFNHNLSGVFVLIIGLGALVDRTGRVAWVRHWPLLYLLLAVFLVFFAEPTVWPLGPESFWATLIVPEVLQHRLATLLVVGLALFEWRVRVGSQRANRWRFAFPVLCGAGGALLLAHSHSILPSKWAFLIEVSHTAIGFLAVLLGGARFLELRLAPPAGRFFGYLWPVCMMLVGWVLLFYRET